jgi:hypothetical protein
MNHFVELTSPTDASEMQSRFPAKLIGDRLPWKVASLTADLKTLGHLL